MIKSNHFLVSKATIEISRSIKTIPEMKYIAIILFGPPYYDGSVEYFKLSGPKYT